VVPLVLAINFKPLSAVLRRLWVICCDQALKDFSFVYAQSVTPLTDCEASAFDLDFPVDKFKEYASVHSLAD
jgi:hypothetical protein